MILVFNFAHILTRKNPTINKEWDKVVVREQLV